MSLARAPSVRGGHQEWRAEFKLAELYHRPGRDIPATVMHEVKVGTGVGLFVRVPKASRASIPTNHGKSVESLGRALAGRSRRSPPRWPPSLSSELPRSPHLSLRLA
jgi:hypothetical protein